MKRVAGLLAVALAACPAADDGPREWPKQTCGDEAAFLRGASGSMPLTPPADLLWGRTCWKTDWQQSAPGQGGPMVFERNPVNGMGGACAFRGTANQVRAEFTEGRCEFPTLTANGEAGYVQFAITEPVGFNPQIDYQLGPAVIDLAGVWREWRPDTNRAGGGDVVYGDGLIRLQADEQIAATDEQAQAPSPKLHPFGQCGAPRCFKFDFTGKGTLRAGGDIPCQKLMTEFGTGGHKAFIDDKGDVRIGVTSDTQPPTGASTIGVPYQTGCGVHTHYMQRGGPFELYDFNWNADGSGTVTMTMDRLVTDQAVTSLCQTTWVATMAPC